MVNDRFKLSFDKFKDIHEISIKDMDGKNQVSIIGCNEAIKDNLESMKKINFLLNRLWEEILKNEKGV